MTALADDLATPPPAPPVRFIVALVVSVALHASFLIASKRGHGGQGHTPLALSVELRPASSVEASHKIRSTIAVPRSDSAVVVQTAPVPPVPVAIPKQAAPSTPQESSEPGWISNLGLPFDAEFYKASELDHIALPVRQLDFESPVVPDSLTGGRVTLWVKIDEYGNVVGVEVEASEPPGVFDQIAISAFERAHFLPATKGGQFVRSIKEVDVCFGDCAMVVPEGVSSSGDLGPIAPAQTLPAPPPAVPASTTSTGKH